MKEISHNTKKNRCCWRIKKFNLHILLLNLLLFENYQAVNFLYKINSTANHRGFNNHWWLTKCISYFAQWNRLLSHNLSKLCYNNWLKLLTFCMKCGVLLSTDSDSVHIHCFPGNVLINILWSLISMLKITIKSLLLIKTFSLSFVLNLVARMKITL